MAQVLELGDLKIDSNPDHSVNLEGFSVQLCEHQEKCRRAVTKGVDTADFCCGKNTTCFSFVDTVFLIFTNIVCCVTKWSKDYLF